MPRNALNGDLQKSHAAKTSKRNELNDARQRVNFEQIHQTIATMTDAQLRAMPDPLASFKATTYSTNDYGCVLTRK